MRNKIIKVTSKTSLLVLVGLATILATGTGQTATDIWSGATSSAWSTGSNWGDGSAPASGDVAQFTSGNATPTLAAGDFTIQRINYTGNVDFNITGAGSAVTRLTLDPTSAGGIAFIGSTAGTATSQTFSALTVILNDSNSSGQVKLPPRNGQQFVIASDAKLQIGSTAAQAVILEAQNASGAGAALTINGVLIGGVAGSSILAENSGVLNLNLAAGSNLENLQLRAGSGGVINFIGGGDFGGSVNPSAGGRFNLATSGITVGSTTGFSFSTGGIIGATYASGTSTLNGQISLATGTGTSTFDVASGGTLALANRVQLGGASAIVEKTGNGTLALTYSSGTGNSFTASAFNVRAGTLLVNNTGNTTASAAAVNVFAGATLAGAGRITGATTISGILAPGNSIGTLRVANDVTWNGGSLLGGGATTDWQFELGTANAADLLQITGAASEFIRGTGTTFRFDFLGSTDTGIFKLVDWESTASVGGGELGTNFAATDFSYTNLGGGNSGTFRFNGSSLEFQAIPEPSSLVMLIGGGVCLILVRRFGRSGV